MKAVIPTTYDWEIIISNWFDRDDVTELRQNDMTFETVQKVVDKFRAKYPKSNVNAHAITAPDDNPSFIACPPLEMEQDEANDIPYEEWEAKWYPEEIFN